MDREDLDNQIVEDRPRAPVDIVERAAALGDFGDGAFLGRFAGHQHRHHDAFLVRQRVFDELDRGGNLERRQELPEEAEFAAPRTATSHSHGPSGRMGLDDRRIDAFDDFLPGQRGGVVDVLLLRGDLVDLLGVLHALIGDGARQVRAAGLEVASSRFHRADAAVIDPRGEGEEVLKRGALPPEAEPRHVRHIRHIGGAGRSRAVQITRACGKCS